MTEAQPVQVRMVDGRIVLPDVLPRTVAVSDAWLRDVVERLNTLSEQEAELAEVHRRIEDRADSYDLAYPEIAAEFRWCSALTQDSPGFAGEPRPFLVGQTHPRASPEV